MNKVKYWLYVFIESLFSDIQEIYSRNMWGNYVLYSLVFYLYTRENGANSQIRSSFSY